MHAAAAETRIAFYCLGSPRPAHGPAQNPCILVAPRQPVATCTLESRWVHCPSALAALASNLCSVSSHVAQQSGPPAAQDTMAPAASPDHCCPRYHAGSEGFRAWASGDGTEPVRPGERSRGEAGRGISTERIQRRQLSRHVHSLWTLCARSLCPAPAQSIYHHRPVAHARRSSAWVPKCPCMLRQIHVTVHLFWVVRVAVLS